MYIKDTMPRIVSMEEYKRRDVAKTRRILQSDILKALNQLELKDVSREESINIIKQTFEETFRMITL